ncbi:hypothetical protein KL919_001958 [Ogataea angusta]|nr:hypothetical protein KL919_001958 [Ogataea angusta]
MTEIIQLSLSHAGSGFVDRKGRKRSKNGCMTCKIRKKRCDEQRPSCGACIRLKKDCKYVSEEMTKEEVRQLRRECKILDAERKCRRRKPQQPRIKTEPVDEPLGGNKVVFNPLSVVSTVSGPHAAAFSVWNAFDSTEEPDLRQNDEPGQLASTQFSPLSLAANFSPSFAKFLNELPLDEGRRTPVGGNITPLYLETPPSRRQAAVRVLPRQPVSRGVGGAQEREHVPADVSAHGTHGQERFVRDTGLERVPSGWQQDGATGPVLHQPGDRGDWRAAAAAERVARKLQGFGGGRGGRGAGDEGDGRVRRLGGVVDAGFLGHDQFAPGCADDPVRSGNLQRRREQVGQVPALRRESDQKKGRDPLLQRVQRRAFSGDQLRVPRHDVCGDRRGPPAALCARGVRGYVDSLEPDPVSGPAARAVVAGVQDSGGNQPAGGEIAADTETVPRPRGAAERGLRRCAKTAAPHGGGLRQIHARVLRSGLQTERGFAKLYTDERHGPGGLRAAADHVRGVPAGGENPSAAVGAAHEPGVDGDPVPGGPAGGVAGHPGGDAAGGVHLLPGVHSRDELCVRGPRADGGAHRRRGEAVPVEEHCAVPAGDERGVEGELERRAVGRLVRDCAPAGLGLEFCLNRVTHAFWRRWSLSRIESIT